MQRSNLLIFAGAGCGVLLLLVLCAGGGIGVWYWQGKPANKPADQAVAGNKNIPDDKLAEQPKPKNPIEKFVDDIKAKNPIKGTAPLGKISTDELAAETPFWDFTIRLPKGLTTTVNDLKQPNDGAVYQWTQQGPQGSWMQVSVTKVRLEGPPEPIMWFFMGVTKFKSDPTDKIPFDTIHMPQPVELNGLPGARSWTLFPEGPQSFRVLVRYRYHVDGWAYVFQGLALGKTEAEARSRAEVVDVAICTFKKR